MYLHVTDAKALGITLEGQVVGGHQRRGRERVGFVYAAQTGRGGTLAGVRDAEEFGYNDHLSARKSQRVDNFRDKNPHIETAETKMTEPK